MADEQEVISVGGGEDSSGSVDISLSLKTNIGPIRRRGDRHKIVECKICFKSIRSDNLKRHMKQHSDLMTMDEDEAYNEIRLRKQQHKEKQKQQLMLNSIVQEMDAPYECIEQDVELSGLKPLPIIDCDEVRERLFLGQREYEQMLEFGKMIYTVVGEGDVKVQSLGKHDKEA